MVYMAGDNGKVFQTTAGPIRLMAEMTSAGYKDIWKMGQVGSTRSRSHVPVRHAARFVPGGGAQGQRHGQQPGAAAPRGEHGRSRERCRTSSSARCTNYPAEHYALVIWNHGLGWLDVDHLRHGACTSWDD